MSRALLRTIDLRTFTGFTFTILLTPVTHGEPGEVLVEVLVCCETSDREFDFSRAEILPEPEFPSFLADCVELREGLAQVLAQHGYIEE